MSTSSEGPAIDFHEVSKTFFDDQGRQHQVLHQISFRIPQGKTTVIAGGSGQGKSVTLKLILGLLKPDKGQIFVHGKNLADLGSKELRQLRSTFGVLFQGSALFDSLSVFENIALPLRERTQLTEPAIRQQVLETLETLELSGHEEKFPAQLSGGMKKRVGLARALQLSPEIMLFDEPTTGLDPLMTLEIYRLFERMQKKLGYTAVIVSHDIPRVFELADSIVLLHRGTVDIFNTLDEIKASTKPHIQEFAEKTMGMVAG
jgi:phospholipid/cholesterol/gamma-HCH transport system ATP-binding protein